MTAMAQPRLFLELCKYHNHVPHPKCYSDAPDKNICKFLHICTAFVAGNCPGNNCLLSHDLKDVHNKFFLGRLGWDTHTDKRILQFLNGAMNTQDVPDSPNQSQLVCKFYNFPKGCERPKKHHCGHLHLCETFLSSNCSDHNCPRSHRLLTDHNVAILKQHDISTTGTEEDALDQLKKCFSQGFHPSDRQCPDRLQNQEENTDISLSPKQQRICLQNLEGTCWSPENCSSRHCLLPYVWQYHYEGEWKDFEDNANAAIETKFCKPDSDGCQHHMHIQTSDDK